MHRVLRSLELAKLEVGSHAYGFQRVFIEYFLQPQSNLKWFLKHGAQGHMRWSFAQYALLFK
jgi:hypothetical protein